MVSAGQDSQTTDFRELRVLEQIERNPRVSQREVARSLGVALGVANACIHTLARKGLVKIRGESNRSITYHLTKKGLTHKARLAVEWTNNTIEFYVRARSVIRDQLLDIQSQDIKTVVLYGADDVVELVGMLAPEAGLWVVDPTEALGHEADAVLVCDTLAPEETDALRRAFPGVPLIALSGAEL